MTVSLAFVGVPIISHDGQARDVAWLRRKYGDSPQVVLRPPWALVRVEEQSAAMTCGIRVLDENGHGIDGLEFEIGWPGTVIRTATRQGGWVDVPLHGANYTPGEGRGPMFIRRPDGSIEYTGIGWPNLTNHDHLNLVIQKGGSPPSVPSVPTAPNVQVLDELRALEKALADATLALDRLKARLGT